MTILAPGATLGILGGGQLGRMAAFAARSMGYRVAIFEPNPASPAAQVSDLHIADSFEDHTAIARFASAVDAVTLEFENVPAPTVELLAASLPVRPGARVLRACQDRRLERVELHAAGVPTAPSMPVERAGDIGAAVEHIGLPALLKTAALGYDSKGQRAVGSEEEARAAFAALGEVPCIFERRIAFEREISVIVARDQYGGVVTYPIAENVHTSGILDVSSTPASITEATAQQAIGYALQIAESLDLTGLLAVEFFVLPDGTVLANEMAPRPHNTGHWSIESCVTSQFLQQVRISLGMPCGLPGPLSPAATANLLGDLWSRGTPRWDRLLKLPDVALHLYGKTSPRPGRKMGHLTALGTSAAEAREKVLIARRLLVDTEGE